jgi:hypothetical protein
MWSRSPHVGKICMRRGVTGSPRRGYLALMRKRFANGRAGEKMRYSLATGWPPCARIVID